MEINEQYLRPILDLKEEILNTRCRPYNFGQEFLPPNELAKIMITTMYANKGIGLSANQIGYPWAVFCAHIGIDGEDAVFFNPRIVDASEDFVEYEEGCLSFPGIAVKIRRPSFVRLRYADFNGEVKTKTYPGVTARIIQHEMDHIEGLNPFRSASKLRMDMAIKKASKKKG